MPLLDLVHPHRPSPSPARAPVPTPTKSWEQLAPLIARAHTTLPLPTITFSPAQSPPTNILLSLLPDPVPFLEKGSAFVLSYLQEAKDPPITEVTLTLSEKEGIAVTSGGVITLFLPYFTQHSKTHTSEETLKEILGVVLHELVHVYQHDSHQTMPGGLIEGVADFLRLRGELGAPHWRKTKGGAWDAGYERTAYFLDWVEREQGEGFVRDLNSLSREKWDLGVFRLVTGRNVEELWAAYQQSIPTGVGEGAPPALPTEAAGRAG